MIRNKLPIVSLIFYILAGLFLLFAIWAAVFSFQYISGMVAMGQVVVRDSLFEITSFHFSNFGQYVVYAALLFAAGWIVYLVTDPEMELVFVDDDEEELAEIVEDELLDEVEED
ncbi:MAG: hypothetical protein K0B06_11770 [Brevefilum sp.]|nr:hypothetical protein [Brevefilum sp.]